VSKRYSEKELGIIAFLISKYGHLTYASVSAEHLEDEYFKLTGMPRVGGAIYMVAWRYEQGYYDHLMATA